MISRRSLYGANYRPLKEYEIGWDFAPASAYLHKTLVTATHEHEALDSLIEYLKEKTGKPIDAWVLDA